MSLVWVFYLHVITDMNTFLITLVLLFSIIVYRAVYGIEEGTTSQKKVFLTGGIGTDEQDVMISQFGQFNFFAIFAKKVSGEYLANVHVRVSNQGRVVLETVTDGPWLFADLNPGTYLIEAASDGQVQTKKFQIRATSNRQRYSQVIFHFD